MWYMIRSNVCIVASSNVRAGKRNYTLPECVVYLPGLRQVTYLETPCIREIAFTKMSA